MPVSEVFIPIFLFLSIAVILWRIVSYFAEIRHSQQATLQKLIDSGQVLSPELVTSISRPKSNEENRDLARGIIGICIAIAIFIYGQFGVNSIEFSWLAAFPLMLGIAFIIIHNMQSKNG